MKQLANLIILLIATILLAASCKKETKGYKPGDPVVLRKIQFLLYTDKDFSDDNRNITFAISIQNSGNQTLWDSTLATMKIKDIPDLAHKIVVEKAVAVNNSAILKIEFRYLIENVGNSWFVDTSNAGGTFKKLEFNFR